MTKKSLNQAKVAIIHDFLDELGGAERVLAALHELFPAAPVYTLRYDINKTRARFANWDIRPSQFGQSRIGRSKTLSLPFLPNAIESWQLADYDIVISSSNAYSKGVITKPTTLHICYCHTPMRYAWDWTHEHAREHNYDRGWRSLFGRLLIHYLRIWDQASASRVDRWLANSKTVARRIKKYYRQPSRVIYPPVEPAIQSKARLSPEKEPYFLIVSRLSPYKRIDLAIEAAAQIKQRLVIIGEGHDRIRLEKLVKQKKAPVTFLSWQDDQTVSDYYAHCQAFLFLSEDDFGIAPVEAMSFGKPVIAFGKGGALETIIEGVTGFFFLEPTVASLVKAWRRYLKEADHFNELAIKNQATKFSKDQFKNRFFQYVKQEWQNWQADETN